MNKIKKYVVRSIIISGYVVAGAGFLLVIGMVAYMYWELSPWLAIGIPAWVIAVAWACKESDKLN